MVAFSVHYGLYEVSSDTCGEGTFGKLVAVLFSKRATLVKKRLKDVLNKPREKLEIEAEHDQGRDQDVETDREIDRDIDRDPGLSD